MPIKIPRFKIHRLTSAAVSVLLAFLIGLVIPVSAQESKVWNFDTPSAQNWTQHGIVKLMQAGPRPPEFPEFKEGNSAISLSRTAYLSVQDSGKRSPFDFTNGDSITLEGWVNPKEVQNSQWQYIIGKGRTNRRGFARDNQNWSLRIAGVDGEARVNFLFATKPKQNSGDSHWHRWTSKNGFPPGTGWHHIALTYTFGKPDSIRGWVNGQPTDGTWDVGGPTTEPPIVDDDEIWIGNRFEGLLDQVAIHRRILSDNTLANRFKRVGKPRRLPRPSNVMPNLADIPAGKVLFTLAEGLPAYNRWPYESEPWPQPTRKWYGDTFLLPRIPKGFDEWGIRSAWKAPVLLRIAADVEWPKHAQKLLIRCRGLSRLWVDGKLVAQTKPATIGAPDGEEPVVPHPAPLFEGARLPSYRQQEVLVELPSIDTSSPNENVRHRRVVWELIVGGKGQRTETAEVCVAVKSRDKTMHLLGFDKVTLRDREVRNKLSEINRELQQLDDQSRRKAAASQVAFWQNRHQFANQWGQSNPAPAIPKASIQGVQHPIDRFLIKRIERARATQANQSITEAKAFHSGVLPILRKNCFRCHGEKIRGGLQLDSHAHLLAGGDSEADVVVPGHPDRSPLIDRIRSTDEELRMPPTGERMPTDEIATLETWIRNGAKWPAAPIDKHRLTLAPIVDDAKFLRRVYLDTVGVPPTTREAQTFLEDPSAGKRERLIERLLKDERCADHSISEWLDLLAENPALINQSLNSTGPFRWFLHDSLRDRKPIDRMVTELILLKGGVAEGGSAGFGVAAENDSPMAAKGHIIAAAFLGIELQCARCHDSPYHQTTQRDLYSLAAMFQRQSIQVPKSSRVPAAFFDEKSRASLIQVTLKPDESVPAQWPFADVTGIADDRTLDDLVADPTDIRERLAALITSPRNKRFARVIVNREWSRLMGSGLVEPLHDWEGRQPSHPQLLDWLAHQLVTHRYDIKHIQKLILTSKAYQREATDRSVSDPELRFFNAPVRRCMTAEQIVDAMHIVTGTRMSVEELTFVHDGRRELGKRQTLGRPSRAWMFASLNNERDRPSLSLPYAQSVVDVLQAFGWTGSRQKPIQRRDRQPNVLQPGILANGVLSQTLTRASFKSELASLALQSRSPQELVDTLFLKLLTRYPTELERETFAEVLSNGFDRRVLPAEEVHLPKTPERLPQVTWFNHGRSKANEIQQEIERRVRRGPPPDPRLRAAWREAYEDVVWSLMNHHEFVWIP